MQPVLRHIVDRNIELRLIRDETANTLVELIRKNQEVLEQCAFEEAQLYTTEHVQTFIQKQQEDQKKGTGFCFEIWLEGKLVGLIYIHRGTLTEPSASVEFWIDQRHRNKGIATTALRALVQAAFKFFSLETIYLFTKEDNPTCSTVAKKVGFRLVSRINNWYYFEITLSDLTRQMEGS